MSMGGSSCSRHRRRSAQSFDWLVLVRGAQKRLNEVKRSRQVRESAVMSTQSVQELQDDIEVCLPASTPCDICPEVY